MGQSNSRLNHADYHPQRSCEGSISTLSIHLQDCDSKGCYKRNVMSHCRVDCGHSGSDYSCHRHREVVDRHREVVDRHREVVDRHREVVDRHREVVDRPPGGC